MHFLILLLVGLFFGFVGAIVGSGGGFLVVPLLLYATDLSPQEISGTSLLVVFFCSLSSTIAYKRQCKIDFKLSKLFIVAMIPGTLIGFFINQKISPEQFTLALGIVLLAISFFMLKGMEFRINHFVPKPVHWDRSIKDSCGEEHDYRISVRRSAVLSFLVGVLSPVVGIGGGVLRVPPMVMVVGIPEKIAAAISCTVTLATSIVAVALFASNKQVVFDLAIPLAVGSIFGAQIGAHYSKKSGKEKVRLIMGLALLFVGGWLLIGSLF